VDGLAHPVIAADAVFEQRSASISLASRSGLSPSYSTLRVVPMLNGHWLVMVL
jgi:hypothetical protein